MRGGAGLEPNKTRRQILEKLNYLATPQLLADNYLLGAIYAVDLEHVLGDIQPDRGSFHVDGSLL